MNLPFHCMNAHRGTAHRENNQEDMIKNRCAKEKGRKRFTAQRLL